MAGVKDDRYGGYLDYRAVSQQRLILKDSHVLVYIRTMVRHILLLYVKPACCSPPLKLPNDRRWTP